MIKINLRNFLIFTIVIFLYLIIKNFLKAKEHLSNKDEENYQDYGIMHGCFISNFSLDKENGETHCGSNINGGSICHSNCCFSKDVTEYCNNYCKKQGKPFGKGSDCNKECNKSIGC